MRAYTLQRTSNYEGYKFLETQAERIAEGDLRPEIRGQRRDPITDYLCDMCKTRKRSGNLVRIRHVSIPGTRRVKGLQGWYVLACDECAVSMRAAGAK